jgi:hypothetical protein
LTIETGNTGSQPQQRSRPRRDLDTIGGFLDSCKDETPILLYFDTAEGIQRVPTLLGDPPTVGQLRLNNYLRPLLIHERERYQIAGTSDTGWVIRVSSRFEPEEYLRESKVLAS